MREIHGPEDVKPMNLFFESYSLIPETLNPEGKRLEILNKNIIRAIPAEEIGQIAKAYAHEKLKALSLNKSRVMEWDALFDRMEKKL